MNPKRPGAIEILRHETTELLKRAGQNIRWSGHGRGQKCRRTVPCQNPADHIQRLISSIHYIRAAAAVDVRIDESRRND